MVVVARTKIRARKKMKRATRKGWGREKGRTNGGSDVCCGSRSYSRLL